MVPKSFLAIYECENCGEELEMINCLVPHFSIFCEGCGGRSEYRSQKMIHTSWEWDYED